MMILVLVVGSVLGWFARRARVQRDAVAAIKQAGGVVFYKWQWANNDLILNASPPGPRGCAPPRSRLPRSGRLRPALRTQRHRCGAALCRPAPPDRGTVAPIGLGQRGGRSGTNEVSWLPSPLSVRTRAFADLRPLREIAAPVD